VFLNPREVALPGVAVAATWKPGICKNFLRVSRDPQSGGEKRWRIAIACERHPVLVNTDTTSDSIRGGITRRSTEAEPVVWLRAAHKGERLTALAKATNWRARHREALVQRSALNTAVESAELDPP